MINKIYSRRLSFFLKIIACFSGLVLMFAVLSPRASLQKNPEIPKMQVNGNASYSPPGTTVHGKVVFEDTKEPVKNAAIAFLRKNGGSSDNSGLTDYEGNFTVENIAPGTYFPAIDSPGILNPLSFMTVEFIASSRANEENFFTELAKNVQVVSVTGEKDLTVTVIAKRGGAVSGQITYADGTPAYGVGIELLRKVNDKYYSSVSFGAGYIKPVNTTDEKGKYRITGLPPGEYVVRSLEQSKHGEMFRGAFMPGFFASYYSPLLSTFYPSTTAIGEAGKINVAAGQENADINIKIVKRNLRTLRGKVIDSVTKQPIANARVEISKIGNPSSFMSFIYGNRSGDAGTRTNGEGVWELQDIPDGSYKIATNFSEYRYNDYSSDYMNKTGAPRYGNSNTNVAYAANMAASAANTAGNAVNAARRAANMANSNMRMANRMTANVASTYSTYQEEKKYTDVEREIQVTGNNQPEIILEPSAAPKISGKIKTDNPLKLPRSLEIIAKDEQLSREAHQYAYWDSKNAFINFTISDIKSSKFYLDIEPPYEFSTGDFYLKSVKYQGAEFLNKPFSVSGSGEIKNVEITLGTDVGKLNGKVLSAKTNVSAPYAALLFVPADEKLWNINSWRRRVWTNQSGGFLVSLPPTEYLVFAFSVDDGQFRVDENWLKKHQTEARRVTIKPYETQSGEFSF